MVKCGQFCQPDVSVQCILIHISIFEDKVASFHDLVPQLFTLDL